MLALIIALALAAAAPPGSHTCLLVGDSHALKLGPFEPDCVTVAKGGITSDQIIAMAPPDAGYTRVIVSMGGNDWRTRAPLADNLAKMRKLYPHAEFTWLAPRGGRVIDVIADFAARHHDKILKLGQFPSRDNAHPSNFADVAAKLP